MFSFTLLLYSRRQLCRVPLSSSREGVVGRSYSFVAMEAVTEAMETIAPFAGVLSDENILIAVNNQKQAVRKSFKMVGGVQVMELKLEVVNGVLSVSAFVHAEKKAGDWYLVTAEINNATIINTTCKCISYVPSFPHFRSLFLMSFPLEADREKSKVQTRRHSSPRSAVPTPPRQGP
jgi:hypothetical protein